MGISGWFCSHGSDCGPDILQRVDGSSWVRTVKYPKSSGPKGADE